MSDETNGAGTPPVYDTGYRKPPVEHRFRKGQSGNPRGRPRKSPAALGGRDIFEAFKGAARKRINVSIDGRQRQMTQLEAVAQQLTLQACKGNTRATKLLVDVLGKYAQEERPPAPPSPNLVVRFVRPGENALRDMP